MAGLGSTSSKYQNDLNAVGHYHNFKNPIGNSEYFGVKPTFPLPHNAKPILDDDSGMIIGYTVLQAPGLWRIYDYDGRFARMQEAGLETPLIDPLDIAFFAYGAFRLLRTGKAIFESARAAAMTVHATAKIMLDEGTIVFLRSRLKIGLSPSALKFTDTTTERMAYSGRFIPVYILEKAIRFGVRTPDPEGAPGAWMYKIVMTRLSKSEINKSFIYIPKDYELEVLVYEKNWTIYHFKIEEL